jgi:hypothetical protein
MDSRKVEIAAAMDIQALAFCIFDPNKIRMTKDASGIKGIK